MKQDILKGLIRPQGHGGGRGGARGLGVRRDFLIHLAPSREVSMGTDFLALGIPNIDTRHYYLNATFDPMSFIVIFCSKGDTLGVSYFEPMRLGHQALTQIKYFGSTFLCIFH